MKLKAIILGACLVITAGLMGQSKLHIPKEFQNAYKKGTRSMDGKPGDKYWQNFVDYEIDVEVAPDTRAIVGSETVVFTNNSPDQLSNIVIRLYYDVFKKGTQRGMQVNPDDIGDGVDIKKVVVNGEEYDLSNPRSVRRFGTNMTVPLKQPLKTGEKVEMKFEWEQKVPLTVRRTGAIDPTSFFIAYWYPQVAVYDDVFGWDTFSYTFDTEFYNNLANFDVNITVPDNFLVWSTGVLQNAEEVFPDDIHKKYTRAKTAKDVIRIVGAEELDGLKMKSGTWNYKATEVPDFAFAMSDHFMWDATSQKVDGRDVLIGTAFPAANADQYNEVTKVQQKTMKHFSEDAPGIPYPYPEFTTFIGLQGGGMEFPMMANNAGPGNGVTIHEMFHTYFPMYVRINERRFAWMDEGWADFATALVTHNFFKSEEDKSSLYSGFKFGMQGMTGTIGDLPTVTSSQYMGNNYGYHSYSLPSFTYSLLYQHLGEEKFLNAWREYIRRWAKKSPTPYDFFYTFEDVTGEDLSWLWETWYFKMGYPDLAIESFNNGKLTVKRLGERPVPISVSVEYDVKPESGKDQSYSTVISTSVWDNDNRTYVVDIPNSSKVKNITINGDFPDFNELDNYFPSLVDRYKKFKMNDGILGEYNVAEFPVSLIIKKEDGILKMEITNSGLSGYLLPQDALNFVTTDGGMTIKFEETDGKVNQVKVDISSFGVSLTGKKE